MTDNKEFPYEAEVLGDHYAVFGPTVLGRNEKGSQFYIGGFRKCASLSEALNLAYAAGVKAERERITQKIIDMQFAFPGFANKTVDRIVESIRQEPA